MIHKNKYALTLMDVTTVDSNADADVADIGDSNDNDRDTGCRRSLCGRIDHNCWESEL